MGSTTDVLPNVGSLEDKLERAKTNLKDLNENIRRIIGREPNDSTQLRGDRKRSFGTGGGGGNNHNNAAATQAHYHHPGSDERRRAVPPSTADFESADRNIRGRMRGQNNNSPPPSKRRIQHVGSHNETAGSSGVKSVFSRLSGPPSSRSSVQQKQHGGHQRDHREPRDQRDQRHGQARDNGNRSPVDGDGNGASNLNDSGDDNGQQHHRVDSQHSNHGHHQQQRQQQQQQQQQQLQHHSDVSPAHGRIVTLVKPRLNSRVIREMPTRQEIVAAQGTDAASRARNRRMFGSLLGTLQKFCQEESRQKPKEDRKAQIEQKLEAQQLQERETMRRERQDLFANRKRQQLEIKQLETKMVRMRELDAWEASKRPLLNFIRTKTGRTSIYYLPKVLNASSAQQLAECRAELENEIAIKRADLMDELAAIEARFKLSTEEERHGAAMGANSNGSAGAADDNTTKHDRHGRPDVDAEEDEDEDDDVEEDKDAADAEENDDVNDDDDDNDNVHPANFLVVKRERLDDEDVEICVNQDTATRSVSIAKKPTALADDKAAVAAAIEKVTLTRNDEKYDEVEDGDEIEDNEHQSMSE